MTCLDDAALVRAHYGDASAAERAHAAACLPCARALASLASDVDRIDRVLRDGAVARRPVRSWRLPLAAAAVLALGVFLARDGAPPVADDDVLTMLDELSVAVATYDAPDLDGGTDAGASTCAWGEPFLEMGCDEPPVTLVAWR